MTEIGPADTFRESSPVKRSRSTNLPKSPSYCDVEVAAFTVGESVADGAGVAEIVVGAR